MNNIKNTQHSVSLIFKASAIFFTIFSQSVFAAGKAKLDVTALKKSDQTVEVSFKAIAADGLKVNHEGPWKLEIKDAGTLKFEKSELKKSEWSDATDTFVQTAKFQSKSTGTDIGYKLTAFVCTADKSQCYRDVIEGKTHVTW